MSKKNIEAIYALSPVQQGMLFHSLYAPGSGVYIQQLSGLLHGRLNAAIFERAWQWVVDRHPILRTAFVWERLEKPMQVVQQQVRLPIERHDWRDRTPEQQAAQLDALLRADQHRDFDLTKAPLLRLALIQLADDRHHFVLTHHHLLLDGWSTPFIFQEVFTAYESFAHGQDLTLPPRRPYRDYINWLKRQDQSDAERFWRHALSGVTDATPFGIDRPRGDAEDPQTAEQQIRLDLDLTGALQRFAAQHRLTVNTLVQGAWAILLSRYSGKDDLVFGSTVSGRPTDLPGADSMIGLFINTLPVRVQLRSEEPLLPWLRALQAQQVELRQFEYSSLVEIHGWSDVPRTQPLFESLLVFENYPIDSTQQTGSLRVQEVRSAVKTNYPLTILAMPGPQLALHIKYDQARFADDAIEHMLAQFRALLAQIVATPDAQIGMLSLVTPEAAELIPDPTVLLPEPRYPLLPEMVGAWAAQTPEQTAISQGRHSWSYRELSARSQTIAQALLARGLRRGETVAIFGGRSFDLIAGMIGTLSGGGVMLPVDPNLPTQRQSLMLREANVRFLLFLGEHPDDAWLRELSALEIICLDSLDTRSVTEQPLPELHPDDPAYVFFTSGTTGVPKGILGCHKGLAHFLSWQRTTFDIQPGDRAAQLINLSFDVVLRDIFLPLVSGATLCLPEDAEILAADRIFNWLETERISLLHTVPAIVQSWLANPAPGVTLATLRYLFFAGEPLTDALVRRWRTAFPAAGAIINLYGPTETTLAKLWYRVPQASDPGIQPVGQPLPETQALILAANGRRCGIGEAGEIVIRTPFRSLGYINVIQAQPFMPNPFRDDDHDLVYRTGDRGRYRADGMLEILGRLDHQIKIRGVRIEPDEVTAILAQEPGVQSCVVVAGKDEQQQSVLIAYVVPAVQQSGWETELRERLARRLPAALVPSVFVLLERLPLTSNGKVDRRALPAPELAQADTQLAFVPPRTPQEALVAEVWAGVLGRDRLGVHDHFFALGGHSLLATQAITRLRQLLDRDLPLRLLFDAPTVAAFAAHLADEHTPAALPPVQPLLHGDQPVPLSFAQQRLWLLHQLAPASAAYHMPTVVRLHGTLDLEALQRSLTDLVARHAGLRTTVRPHPNDPSAPPVQHIAPPWSVSLPSEDLGALPPDQQSAALIAQLRTAIHQPFDLHTGPLVRALLVALQPHDHVLLLVVHHLVSDGWSQDRLLHELTLLYRHHAHATPLLLPDLPIQYTDYAVWQRQWLQGPVLDDQLAYWRQQLAGLRPLALPTDYPRSRALGDAGARVAFTLDPVLSQALTRLSQQHGVTLFMTLLAAFQLLLGRLSQQTDVAVGTPIAGRVRPELEGVVGCFINTLVLRTDLTGQPRFRDLLARVRSTTLAAYAQQDLPFELLVEQLQPERDLHTHPFFQVLFVLQNTPHPTFELPELTLEAMPLDREAAQFDLTVTLNETAAGIQGMFEYRTALFAEATVMHWAAQFHTLLEAIVADPSLPITALPLLPPTERHQLLTEWNPAPFSAPETTVHMLIAAQATRTPDAIAVIGEDEVLSYRELEERSNRLAHHLRSLGVGPEARVGLCLDRSPELIVALLAILKAGAAYVPLDPAHPAARLRFIGEDAQLAALLTQEALLRLLPAITGPVVCVDRDQERIAQQPPTSLPIEVQPQQLAYVIYTSGSTGQPKGVLIDHRALLSYVCAARERYRLHADDRVLQFASITFDASVEEIYPTLVCGATLRLRTDELLASPTAFFAGCQDWEITVASLPTAFWHLLAEGVAAGLALPTTLRLVIIGGERVLPARVEAWQTQVGERCEFINSYGPTEATVVATTYSVPPSGLEETQEVPLGRPLANGRVYLLDPQMQLVPIGGRGEIYLGGTSLARGYLRQPALTAERFVPDPFSHPEGTRPGARLYRTGDLGRWRSDGQLEFLGRIDQQVKIRGFRIEPDEIAMVLMRHPQVRDAVIRLWEEPSGEKRLVAYVVAEHGNTGTREHTVEEHGSGVSVVDPSGLRRFMAEQLPDYMLPSAVVMLDALPLTSNGKVDRRALPAPDRAQADTQLAFVPPRTPQEALVAEVWAGVLGRDRLGVHDHFFALGGHSLLATQAITRLRQLLDRDLPLRLLFDAPTVAAFAAHLAHLHAPATLPPLHPNPHRDQPVPLSFAQQRLWLLHQLAPASAAYHMPTVVRLHGSLDRAALERSLTDLVARHAGLRTTVRPHPHDSSAPPVQHIAPPWSVSLPSEDLAALPPDQQSAALIARLRAAIHQPFDLHTGPLVRALLVALQPRDHVLLLVVHHVVSDGWSQDRLLHELTLLYRHHAHATPLALPDLPIQYTDYAVWQRQWLQGAVLDDQLAYWRQQLAGLRPLALPTDYPRSQARGDGGARVAFTLEPALSQALTRLSQQHGVTLFMTLLAAFQLLLGRLSQQTDVAVGTPIAGRVQPELENVIGCFVNTLVLRTDLTGQPRFHELLGRVRSTTLAAYAQQDLPFELLVEQLQPERDLHTHPFFQVLFVLQNTPRPTLELPEIEMEWLEVPRDTARFDLTILLNETAAGIQGTFEYRTALFAEATVARWAAQFHTLLESIVADPSLPITALPLLPPAERHLLLTEWNATERVYPSDCCIHQLVEAQAARTPDALAVIHHSARLSYADLDRRADQLAYRLRQLGVGADPGAEVLVGVCLSRSPDLLVALLAVLKAGGAYVPIDPAYPQERIAFLLDDSRAPVLLTEHDLLAVLPPEEQRPSAQTICLDRFDWDAAPTAPATSSTMRSENLAYVIYTSGSTGRPKGVAISHRSAVALLSWAQTVFSADDLAGVLASTSICFDLSVFEIFLPLSCGGTVILAENALELPQLPHADDVTLINTVPSAIAELLRIGGVPASVRTVNLAGEPLHNTLVQQIYHQATIQQVFNLYGPSEDTTYSTFVLTEKGSDATTTIGRPIANTQVYLLDAYGQPVPIGVVGELYLGGDGLARGYLRRPELTADRFIPNPFGDVPGTRLYRTGDLARYRADGQIEFLGRIDHQVKIRGFRIELGEIEAALRKHPLVASCVVVVRQDEQGDPRLVAYVVENQEPRTKNLESLTECDQPAEIEAPLRLPKREKGLGDEGLSSSLREFLASRLPAYMVPSVILELESLPLTPNGKIDRKALPAPATERALLESTYVAPRTADEAALAQIWAEVLGLDRVGVLDDFFALGGHSLAAVRVVAQIRETLQIELPLRQLFETPTIATLAEELRAGGAALAEAVVDLQAEARLDPAIQPTGPASIATEPSAILLTGATGFLGAYLLHELVQQTQAQMYCLVRADDQSAALQRIRQSLAAQQLWSEQIESRIVPIVGDLAQPLLGLEPRDFAALAETIDVIYHNGALVNLIYPYPMLKAANVLGTQEVLRLASQSRIKPVHFVSTTSVFFSNAYAGAELIHEHQRPEQSDGLDGGYAQSKWVAEQLVIQARERGIPCNIYRPGRIGWHSQTGLWTAQDALYKVIKGCLQIGSAPELDRNVEIIPVDYVSRAIVALAKQPELLGNNFHLINQHAVHWLTLVDWMRDELYPLRRRSYDDWQAELAQSLASSENVLYPLLAVAPPSRADGSDQPRTGLAFDDCNTRAGLAGTGIDCPIVDAALLRVFFESPARADLLADTPAPSGAEPADVLG